MVREYVIKFLKSLNENERKKLKVMLQKGITCCVGIAKDLNISPEEFNAELREVLR